MTELNEHDKERLVREGVFHVLTQEIKRPIFTKGSILKAIDLASSPSTIQIEMWKRILDELKLTFGYAMVPNPDEKKGKNRVFFFIL